MRRPRIVNKQLEVCAFFMRARVYNNKKVSRQNLNLNNMKKILSILTIFTIGIFSTNYIQADNPHGMIQSNAQSLYIVGNGNGETIEQAKIVAITDVLNQLSHVEGNTKFPTSESYTASFRQDGVTRDQGVEKLLAKLYTEGRWLLEDGIYHYSIEILIQREVSEKDKNQ